MLFHMMLDYLTAASFINNTDLAMASIDLYQTKAGTSKNEVPI